MLICEVIDDGTHNLSDYRRIIFKPTGNDTISTNLSFRQWLYEYISTQYPDAKMTDHTYWLQSHITEDLVVNWTEWTDEDSTLKAMEAHNLTQGKAMFIEQKGQKKAWADHPAVTYYEGAGYYISGYDPATMGSWDGKGLSVIQFDGDAEQFAENIAKAWAKLKKTDSKVSAKPIVHVGIADDKDTPSVKFVGTAKRAGDGSFQLIDGAPWGWIKVGEDAMESLKVLRSFTIMGWVKPDSLQIGHGGNRILFCLKENRSGIDLVHHNDGRMRLSVNEWPDQIQNDSSAGKLQVGKWTFFAVSYDSTASSDNMSWYFSTPSDTPGQSTVSLDQKTSYNPGPVDSDVGPLVVGNFNETMKAYGMDRQFRGEIRALQIFGSSKDGNGALKADEIASQSGQKLQLAANVAESMADPVKVDKEEKEPAAGTSYMPYPDKVVVTKVEHFGNMCWKIAAAGGTWYFENGETQGKSGFSSAFDQAGNDWIGNDADRGFNISPNTGGRHEYRGWPNFGEGNFDHPQRSSGAQTLWVDANGNDIAFTDKLEGDHLIMRSANSDYELEYHFFTTHAAIKVLKANKKYAFLYEGPIGGEQRCLSREGLLCP